MPAQIKKIKQDYSLLEKKTKKKNRKKQKKNNKRKYIAKHTAVVLQKALDMLVVLYLHCIVA